MHNKKLLMKISSEIHERTKVRRPSSRKTSSQATGICTTGQRDTNDMFSTPGNSTGLERLCEDVGLVILAYRLPLDVNQQPRLQRTK